MKAERQVGLGSHYHIHLILCFLVLFSTAINTEKWFFAKLYVFMAYFFPYILKVFSIFCIIEGKLIKGWNLSTPPENLHWLFILSLILHHNRNFIHCHSFIHMPLHSYKQLITITRLIPIAHQGNSFNQVDSKNKDMNRNRNWWKSKTNENRTLIVVQKV